MQVEMEGKVHSKGSYLCRLEQFRPHVQSRDKWSMGNLVLWAKEDS